MAQPAKVDPGPDEAPIVDPSSVDRGIRMQRAKRSARIEREREARNAHLRFWFVLGGLFLGLLVLLVTIWEQIQNIFGL